MQYNIKCSVRVICSNCGGREGGRRVRALVRVTGTRGDRVDLAHEVGFSYHTRLLQCRKIQTTS